MYLYNNQSSPFFYHLNYLDKIFVVTLYLFQFLLPSLLEKSFFTVINKGYEKATCDKDVLSGSFAHERYDQPIFDRL